MTELDRCLICGRPRRRTRRYGGTDFEECLSCGYALLSDPSSRADYWPESHESGMSDYWIGAKNAYFKAALDLLERESRGCRLLDVGGGIGYFCQLALDRGWDAYSLDISSQATALAAERLGSERALTDLDGIPEGSFDVATLWCVIAHTLHPQELLRGVRRCLSPAGVVWLTTPNLCFQKPYARLRARLGKPIDFAAEDHLGHFTLAALEQLLKRNGFGSPHQHFVGITETCLLTSSNRAMLVGLKRTYNRIAFLLARSGLANLVSELQVTARAHRDL